MKRILSLVVCVLLAGAGFAADNLTCIPLGTDLIFSVNVQQIVHSPLFERIKEKKLDAQAEARLRVLQNLTGIDPLQDIQRATLFGTPGDDSSMMLRLQGRFDPAKLTSLVEAAPQYACHEVAGHKLHEWYDEREKRMKYGTFLSDGSILVGNRADRLDAALRAAASGQGMQNGALPAGREQAAAWALVMRPDAGRLGNKTLSAQQLAGVLKLSPTDVAARLVLSTDTAEAAHKWLELVRGGLALLQLQNEHPVVAAIAARASVAPGPGQSVDLNVTATHDQFLQLVRRR